jgi:hypothetical protein
LWAAGLYKGWVSKHNPDTILERIFPVQKKSLKKVLDCGENVDWFGGFIAEMQQQKEILLSSY